MDERIVVPGTSAALYAPSTEEVSEFWTSKYEREAGRFWDRFYRRNGARFFKDRHYLAREFPLLAAPGRLTLLEVGCGAGNTAFPLLELNPEARVFACDFAPRAVELVLAHPAYAGGRVSAFVADVTADDLTQHVPPASVDVATMLFVLSAIAPAKMPQAVANVARTLAPGRGRVLLRDYAAGDLAQERLAGPGRQQRLAPDFYVRGDGTRCFYFSQEGVQQLFDAQGFECESVHIHERRVENRARGLAMDRRWLQAVFRLRAPGEQAGSPARCAGGQALGSSCAPPGEPCATAACSCSAAACRAASGAIDLPGQQPSACAAAGAATSWLAGAAGRLASCRSPGVPSGRSQLPETLECADDEAATLSPARRASKRRASAAALADQVQPPRLHHHAPRAAHGVQTTAAGSAAVAVRPW